MGLDKGFATAVKAAFANGYDSLVLRFFDEDEDEDGEDGLKQTKEQDQLGQAMLP